MSFREEAFEKEAAEWNKAIEISTATAAEKAQLHDKIVNELKNSLREAVENAKKEAAKAEKEASRADEAEQTVKDLEKDKSSLQKEKNDLSAKVDLLGSELQMLKDLQDKMIEDAKEEAIDNAWYCMWSTNPMTLDLEFMGDELEPALARWNARLELEQLEETRAADAGADDEDGNDNDAISSALKTGSSRLEEITKEARAFFGGDDSTPAPTEAATIVETARIASTEPVSDLPTEADHPN